MDLTTGGEMTGQETYPQETLNTLILTCIEHFNPGNALQLYRKAGSATAVIDNRLDIRSILPDCSQRVADALNDIERARRKAENEMEYTLRNGIKTLCIGTDDYPRRLRECADAPLALFYKGTAELNRRRVISIVGTRRCTAYGQDCVRSFVKDLRAACPDTLIVSGLAYGIDICAHREALANGTDTVAVLAHGLDYLYPPRHKDTADKMLTQGGLLTEFFTHTNADKLNFLRRNRIVAGISDATIVVESASHGGGLVTARIATSYDRDVFAFPGRAGDECSQGCNNLIRDRKATLITCADDFVRAMGWQDDARLETVRRQGIETTLFPDLSDDEQRAIDTLKGENDLQINSLAARTGQSIGNLTAIMFSLEMKGMVRCLAGGVYHLLRD